MRSIHYRRWCPPESPLGVEFPPELLHEVRLEGAQAATAARLTRTNPRDRAEDHSRGVLFGVQQNQEVRILAARSAPDRDDPKLAGMQPVGVFVCRARGEVFLTDDDLAMFETAQGSVALVVAGGQAGFFVRQGDGSVQAIRSHEEFMVANVSAMPAPELIPAQMRPVPPPRRLWSRAMTGTGLLCLPVAAFAFLQPAMPQPPLALTLHEDAGQLTVVWDVPLRADLGRLEIVDGSERTLVHLSPAQTSMTFAHQTGDVEIRLDTGTREGSARWESAYYKPPTLPQVVDPEEAKAGVMALEREAENLSVSIETGKTHIEALSRRIGRLALP